MTTASVTGLTIISLFRKCSAIYITIFERLQGVNFIMNSIDSPKLLAHECIIMK